MMRCEEVFRQICWLEERFWPDVDGMGEEDESARLTSGASIGGIAADVGAMGSGMDNASDTTTVADARNTFGLNGGIDEQKL